jgi:hypothetical protein
MSEKYKHSSLLRVKMSHSVKWSHLSSVSDKQSSVWKDKKVFGFNKHSSFLRVQISDNALAYQGWKYLTLTNNLAYYKR